MLLACPKGKRSGIGAKAKPDPGGLASRFEDIVWDIYTRKWNDPDAQRYGRTGQPQQGVDVYGRPAELDGRYAGSG